MATLKPRNLPNVVKLALATYFYHREKQNSKEKAEANQAFCQANGIYGTSIKIPDAYIWDKDADLKALEKVCPKNWSWSAICGTFWFSYENKYGTVITRQVNETNYLDGGEIAIKRKEKPKKTAKVKPVKEVDTYEPDPEAAMYGDNYNDDADFDNFN